MLHVHSPAVFKILDGRCIAIMTWTFQGHVTSYRKTVWRIK